MNNGRTLAISVAFELWTNFEGDLLVHCEEGPIGGAKITSRTALVDAALGVQ